MSRPREFDVDRALHQSMETFWSQGFKSTSYEDLTRATGVKKQSLYGVFKDKRTFFLKALARYREQSLADLRELEARDISPLEKLEIFRDSFVNDQASCRGCLMVNSALEFGTEDEQVIREAELMFAESEQILERIVLSGQQQGLITTRFSSKELAGYLNNAVSGAKILEKSGASAKKIEAVLRTSFAMLMP